MHYTPPSTPFTVITRVWREDHRERSSEVLCKAGKVAGAWFGYLQVADFCRKLSDKQKFLSSVEQRALLLLCARQLYSLTNILIEWLFKRVSDIKEKIGLVVAERGTAVLLTSFLSPTFTKQINPLQIYCVFNLHHVVLFKTRYCLFSLNNSVCQQF